MSFKAPSGSDIRASRRNSFHHLGGKTEKSLDTCPLCALRDGGRAVLEERREHGGVWGCGGVMSALR